MEELSEYNNNHNGIACSLDNENKFDAKSAVLNLRAEMTRKFRAQQSDINELNESHQAMKTVQEEAIVRLDKVEAELKDTNGEFGNFFREESSRRIMEVLATLCDGKFGVAGWIPVKGDDPLYVVLSKRVTACLIDACLNMGVGVIDTFLSSNLKTVTVDPELFKRIMFRTPFTVYKKGAKTSDLAWMRKNIKHYMIMEASWFKRLVEETRERFDVPKELPTAARQMVMQQKKHMVDKFSVACSYTMKPAIYENMGDGIELSQDQLAAMPAMHFPFCIEAYKSGSFDYFNMYEVDGKLGHVCGGEYKEPHGKVYAGDYQHILSMAKKHVPHNFSNEVKAAYPDQFDFPGEEEKEEPGEDEEEEEEEEEECERPRASARQKRRRGA